MSSRHRLPCPAPASAAAPAPAPAHGHAPVVVARPTRASRHRAPRLAVLLAGLAVAATAMAAGPAPTAAPAAADRQALVDTGRRTYLGLCARCHGVNLAASPAYPDLRRFPAGDRARFEQVVREGRRAMPAFGRHLSPVQVDALWAYVGSVNGW